MKKAPRAWYGRIDSFMMSLGFTKSKEDSNIYYKVGDSGPVILLFICGWHVSNMGQEYHHRVKDNSCVWVLNERTRYDALHFGSGCVGEIIWDFPMQGKICGRNPKEIWYDFMKCSCI